MGDNLDTSLKTIYCNLDKAASYSSAYLLYPTAFRLWKITKILHILKLKNSWLKSQATYTSHREVKTKFKCVYAPYMLLIYRLLTL